MIKWIVNRKLRQLKKAFPGGPNKENTDRVYYTESKEFCLQICNGQITYKQLKEIDNTELRIVSISWNEKENVLELILKPKRWFAFVITSILLIGILTVILLI